MIRESAFLWSVLQPSAARALGMLIVAALLAVLLWSVLVPSLAVPELSPTRWYTLARPA